MRPVSDREDVTVVASDADVGVADHDGAKNIPVKAYYADRLITQTCEAKRTRSQPWSVSLQCWLGMRKSMTERPGALLVQFSRFGGR
jgi:hypothetical protein